MPTTNFPAVLIASGTPAAMAEGSVIGGGRADVAGPDVDVDGRAMDESSEFPNEPRNCHRMNPTIRPNASAAPDNASTRLRLLVGAGVRP